jgi:RimJ/RimL family protein N-acetyltransferase
VIRLVPMSEAEFQAYLDSALQDYAQEHVRAGNWDAQNALQLAEQQFHHLLPDGLATENHYFSTIEIEDGVGDRAPATKVGMLWFGVQDRGAGPRVFVYDMVIHEPFRRRGYGTQAFQALEEKVRELGLSEISLHVFAHNHAARAMYEKLGYVVTDIMMSKTIGSSA